MATAAASILTLSDMSRYRIPDSDEAFYISDFVSEAEEQYMIRKICETPRQRWKTLSNRRLQVIGGDLTPQNVLISQPMPGYINTFPNMISRIKETGLFGDSPHGKPNHVLLNEYLPGQGIMPHEDGPAYHPVVATVSLGSHAVFHYYKHSADHLTREGASSGKTIDPAPAMSVLLQPRSLIVTRNNLYYSLHGIQNIKDDAFAPVGTDGQIRTMGLNTVVANGSLLPAPDCELLGRGGVFHRGTRYSLTFRDVKRTSGAKKFGPG